jgi:hypothetical protein
VSSLWTSGACEDAVSLSTAYLVQSAHLKAGLGVPWKRKSQNVPVRILIIKDERKSKNTLREPDNHGVSPLLLKHNKAREQRMHTSNSAEMQYS